MAKLDSLATKEIKQLGQYYGFTPKRVRAFSPDSGKELELSEEQEDDLLKLYLEQRVVFSNDDEIPMLDTSDGSKWNIPGKNINEALSKGYVFDTPLRQQMDYVADQVEKSAVSLKDIGASVLSGAFVGTSDLLLDQANIVPGLLRKARREQMPLQSFIEEMFGMVAASYLSRGESVPASIKEIAKYLPSNVINVAGEKTFGKAIKSLSGAEAAGKLATEGLSNEVRQMIGNKAFITSLASAGMVEGALSSGVYNISEQLMDDKEFSAESLLSSVGYGGIFGAGIGAGIGGLSAGSRKLSEMMKNTKPRIYRILEQNLTQKEGTLSRYEKAIGEGFDESVAEEAESVGMRLRDEFDVHKENLKSAKINKEEALGAIKDSVKKAEQDLNNITSATEEMKNQNKQKIADRLDELDNAANIDRDALAKDTLDSIDKIKNQLYKVDDQVINTLEGKKVDAGDIYDIYKKSKIVYSEDGSVKHDLNNPAGPGEQNARFHLDSFEEFIKRADLDGKIDAAFLKRHIKSIWEELKAKGIQKTDIEDKILKNLAHDLNQILHDESKFPEYSKYMKPQQRRIQAIEDLMKKYKIKDYDKLALYDRIKGFAKDNVKSEELKKFFKELDELVGGKDIEHILGETIDHESLLEKYNKIINIDSDPELTSIRIAGENLEASLKGHKELKKLLKNLDINNEADLKKAVQKGLISDYLLKKVQESGITIDDYVKILDQYGIDFNKLNPKTIYSTWMKAVRSGDPLAIEEIRKWNKFIQDTNPDAFAQLEKLADHLNIKVNLDKSGAFSARRNIVNNVVFAAILGKFLGMTGVGAATGLVVGKVFDTHGGAIAKNLVEYYAGLSGISRTTGAVKNKMYDSIDKFLGTKQGNRMYGVGSYFIRASGHEFGENETNGEMTVKKYKEIQEKLINLMNNPEALHRYLQDSTKVVDMAPEIQSQMIEKAKQKVMFLYSKMPKARNADLEAVIPGTHVPSDSELAKFGRYFKTANNIFSVYDDLNKNTLTKEQIEVLNTLYPSFYNDSKRYIVEQMGSGQDIKLSYQKRLSLSTFLGVPLDPSLKAGFILDLQSLHAMSNAVQSNQDASQIRSEAANRRMTDTQKSLTRA